VTSTPSRQPMSREEALAMEGTGWSGDLDELRASEDTAGSGDPPDGS
jgi:hypothetical protein